MSSQLPARPNLEHLKAQAADLLKSFRNGQETARIRAVFPDRLTFGLAQAQLVIAREYGFESWSKLKFHVASLYEAGQLKDAIDANDLDRVKSLMTHNPGLHRANLGYAGNGPLTWAAECRIPWGISPERLEIVKWMLENGSDIHQGGDGPLMRAALMGYRIPMMELLVSHGADVNAEWAGDYPIIFAPCETMEPKSLKWLLEHGAEPNCDRPGRKSTGTALDQVISGYLRSPNLAECIQILVHAGGESRYQLPPMLDLLSGRIESLEEHIDADPGLVHQRFPELDFGQSGARRLTLKGSTLLHVAAEYGKLEAAQLLLDKGADVNALADLDDSGIGGQTPIFHAVTQFPNRGLPITRLLVERGADLTIRAKLPGHYERPDEVVECTPLGYSELFPGDENETVAFLRIVNPPATSL